MDSNLLKCEETGALASVQALFLLLPQSFSHFIWLKCLPADLNDIYLNVQQTAKASKCPTSGLAHSARRGFKGAGLQGDQMCNEKGIKTSISAMNITNAETCNPSLSHSLMLLNRIHIGSLASPKLMPASHTSWLCVVKCSIEISQLRYY